MQKFLDRELRRYVSNAASFLEAGGENIQTNCFFRNFKGDVPFLPYHLGLSPRRPTSKAVLAKAADAKETGLLLWPARIGFLCWYAYTAEA